MVLTSTVLAKGLNITYPCLKSNPDQGTVLFTEPGKGIVVANGPGSLSGLALPIGTVAEFDENMWSVLLGSVVLEQKP
jgi:hypothetical protein